MSQESSLKCAGTESVAGSARRRSRGRVESHQEKFEPPAPPSTRRGKAPLTRIVPSEKIAQQARTRLIDGALPPAILPALRREAAVAKGALLIIEVAPSRRDAFCHGCAALPPPQPAAADDQEVAGCSAEFLESASTLVAAALAPSIAFVQASNASHFARILFGVCAGLLLVTVWKSSIRAAWYAQSLSMQRSSASKEDPSLPVPEYC